MITKEQFIEIMTRFKEYKEIQNEITTAMKKLSPEFNFYCDEIGEQLIVDLLSIATKDKYGEITYYIYETDFGTNGCADSVWDENGNKIPFKTSEDVYNLIQSDNEGIKKEEN